MRKAFTLVEMMIVVASILVLSAVAYPLFNSYQARNNVRQAARLLASDLGRTEEEARRIGLSGTVNAVPGYSASLVSVAAGGAVIFSDLLPANVTTSWNEPLYKCPGAAGLQFPSRVVLGAGLAFNPQGIPSYCLPNQTFPNNPITLFVQDNRGNSAVVTVDARTGAVSGP